MANDGLPAMYKALSSVPSIKLGMVPLTCNLNTYEREAGGFAAQGHPCLSIEMEASLSYLRSYLKKKNCF